MDSDEALKDAKEMREYQESLESALQMVEDYNKLSSAIQVAISENQLNTQTVASLESAVPGILLDDHDVDRHGGPLNPEAYSIALEQTIATEMDMALFLMGKFFKLNLKGAKLLAKYSARLAGVVATFTDTKMVNGSMVLLGSSLRGVDKIPGINFKNLSSDSQSKIVKLVKGYTGNVNVGETEVIKTIEAVKGSKNGIEIMSKIYMPKYSNMLLPLFYIPNSDYKGVLSFFKVMDETVLPKVDTNLNTAIMQLNTIMQGRDWVALSKFDTVIFNDKDKSHIYKLATHVKADVKPTSGFKKNVAKTNAALSELLGTEKKGLQNDPKYHQALDLSVKDLESIKDHILSISDTMSDMTKHSESRTGTLTRDMRKFRASKTLKESFKSGRSINKYSNAAYSRVMQEMRDVAVVSAFMAATGNDVISAYTNVFTRANALNTDTVKFVEKLNKILGE